MEEYILRSKKEAIGRKKPSAERSHRQKEAIGRKKPSAERSHRQKEAGTAQKNKKNGKSRKAAAATNFPLLLHAAAKTPKNGYKGRGPKHSTTKQLHGKNASTATPSIHHSTKNLPPP
jgi:hypothetical protein